MDLDIHHVARLARLELTEAEAAHLAEQLGRILEHVRQLEALDTSDVEPTSHAVPLSTPFRADEVGAQLPRREALANAPEQDGIAFVVPRVV